MLTFRNSARWTPILLILTLGGVAALSSIPLIRPIGLLWNYPTNQFAPDLVFYLKGTTDLSVPQTNWPVEAIIPATNWFSNGVPIATVEGTNYVLSVTQPVIAGQHFWYMTTSNFWGESDPSNVVALPSLPRGDLNVRAVKGW